MEKKNQANEGNKQTNKKANVISYLEIPHKDWKSWVPKDKMVGWEGSEPPATSGFHNFFKSHTTRSEIEDELKQISEGQNPTLCWFR